ncbi:MAG: hypothetical protein MUF73_17225 [Rhodobacteraceae bacterium]|nr:hypothetical protein [Paracoccaceae bacterium]
MTDPSPEFGPLRDYLGRVPGVRPLSDGRFGSGVWWAKFDIDIAHTLAWHVVQEFGHVLNYLSPDQRLPTVFKPVSPPPYMNGGPARFLSWVIECSDPAMSPGTVMQWLQGRLPRPVEDLSQWISDDD